MSKKRSGRYVSGIKMPHGKNSVVDKSLDPQQLDPLGHVALEETVQATRDICFELLQEFEQMLTSHGLKPVAVDEFIEELYRQVRTRRVADSHLRGCLEGTILVPLRYLYARLQVADATLAEVERKLVGAMWREQTTTNADDNFSRMLAGFEKQVESLRKLGRENEKLHQATERALEEANALAKQGEQQGDELAALESSLDALVRKINNSSRKPANTTKESLDQDYQQLEEQLERFSLIRKQLEFAQTEYVSKRDRFYIAQDSLSLFKGEWSRGVTSIEQWATLFAAVELDPFALLGMNREAELTKPENEAREELIAARPKPFPAFTDQSVTDRVQKAQERILAALDRLDQKDMEQTMEKSVPAVAAESSVEPPKSVRAVHLITCTLAAQEGGLTLVEIVEVLEKCNLCCGHDRQALGKALVEANQRRYIDMKKSGYWFVTTAGQRTLQGCNWHQFLPASFVPLIQAELGRRNLSKKNRG